VARFLLGRRIREISCVTERLGPENSAWGSLHVEDTASIRMRLDGGIEAVIALTWAADARETLYWVEGEREQVLLHDESLTRSNEGGTSTEGVLSDFNDPAHTGWIREVLREFRQSLMSDSVELRRSLAERALQEALDVSAAYRSAAMGGDWVHVEDASDLLDWGSGRIGRL